MGMWAAACGALAGGQGIPERAALVPLLFVLLLVSLGWVAAWLLITETDWFLPVRSGWPPRQPALLPAPPYMQPHSPAGRLWRGAGQVVGWWGESFWPAAGGTVAAVAAALVLAAVFSLLLYEQGGLVGDDVRRLAAAYIALAGVGLVWRRHGRDWLAGRALGLVALPWLAGQRLVSQLAGIDLAASPAHAGLAFALAMWGTERLGRGLRGSGWLIGAAQAGVVALLVAARQPLAAGAAGALLLAQLALLPAAGTNPERAALRARRWLMAMMVLASMGLP